MRQRRFPAPPPQAVRRTVRGFGATCDQPVPQLLKRGGHHKDHQRVGTETMYLHRAVHLNFQNDVITRVKPLFDKFFRGFRSSFPLYSVYSSISPPAIRQLKLLPADKVVVNSVHLSLAGSAGGRRHREHQPRLGGEQRAEQRPLADPRRGRNKSQAGRAYSSSSSSSSSSPRRLATVSGCTADKIT